MTTETKTKKAATTKKASTKTTTAKRVSKKAKLTFEQIQLRAYQIYVENDYKGNEMENWIKAEKELLNN